MSAIGHPFMDKVFVGSPVPVGSLGDKYQTVLIEGETIDMEFKGLRDRMLFTSHRIVVFNSQGLTGKKVEISSFAWKAVTAFSVENSGTLDLDAEFKFCGSGWGVCEVQLTKGTDIKEIVQYVGRKALLT